MNAPAPRGAPSPDNAERPFPELTAADIPALCQLIREMKAALEICLESKGIKWEAEHDADICIRRATRLGL